MKTSHALGLAILVVSVTVAPRAEAADPAKLYGTWVTAEETPNSGVCNGLSYVFTPKTQRVGISGGAPGNPLNVTYVDGGGQRIGVWGNTTQPLIFNLLDNGHLQVDGLPSCILKRQE